MYQMSDIQRYEKVDEGSEKKMYNQFNGFIRL